MENQNYSNIFGEIMKGFQMHMAYDQMEKELDNHARAFKLLAKSQRMYYDALVEQGFTEDEAFELLLNKDL